MEAADPNWVGDALASYAESWMGAKETSSNRGPEVDFFVHTSGGRPVKRPPWCAYFVTFCCDQLRRMGLELHSVRTGRAVNHWLKAEPERHIARDDIWEHPDPRGLIYVRTRTSKPINDANKVRRGVSRSGHVGIVSSIEGDTIIGVAGNSSGAGHSSGSGAVCTEVIKKGDRAWERIVGFVSVVEPPMEVA
tara:strand:+ start:201 stop:776 length:576 start_codon:yes stop_codon:yes gene_type:complete